MTEISSAFWAAAWEKARQKASLYCGRYDERAWTAFWDQYASTYRKINGVLQDDLSKMVAFWVEEGLVNSRSRVLDIGCGPGTYALPLAEVAKEVTALDTSGKMLWLLSEEARKRGLQNIIFMQDNWEKANYDKEFDLVLAASSPAVYNYDTLMKMNSASRGFCLLLCYARGYRAPLRHLLWREVMGEELQGSAFDISFPFNILYAEGFNPNLRFFSQGYSYSERADVVMENFLAYFNIFGKKGPGVERILEKVVRSQAKDGLITEKVSYNLAVMWWNAS
ncbi:MAG: class I SAM-dependent methyltransferase [Bacillota bacterium]